jgi:hypothetical protein
MHFVKIKKRLDRKASYTQSNLAYTALGFTIANYKKIILIFQKLLKYCAQEKKTFIFGDHRNVAQMLLDCHLLSKTSTNRTNLIFVPIGYICVFKPASCSPNNMSFDDMSRDYRGSFPWIFHVPSREFS